MVAKIPGRKNMGKLFTNEEEYCKHLHEDDVKQSYTKHELYKGRGRPKKFIDITLKKKVGEYILSFD
tara:strand:+ start:4024 stop:4224 length:201 start_codon:yes stop_codon:yes gene_type:complete